MPERLFGRIGVGPKPDRKEILWPILTLKPAEQIEVLDKARPSVERKWRTDLLLIGAGLLVAKVAASLVEPGLARDILVLGSLMEASAAFYQSSQVWTVIRGREEYRSFLANKLAS